MNIFNKIHAIQQEVSYIQKDARVQGYAAVTHDQVTAHVRDSCVKHGVLIIPTQEENGVVVDAGKTSKGTQIVRYEAVYEIRFIDAETGEIFSTRIQAHAMDQGDKAPGKCLSYAVKYAMLKVFMLETGENDESRVEPQRRAQEKIRPGHVQWIETQIEEKGIDRDAFMGYLKKNRVNNIADITIPFFEDVARMIQNHKGVKNA